ncbi:MAG: radical SAM protein [Desulfovibrionaceae bacterium]|nr:radical SAM protein [Desulfovibrionaceae bacterium]
MASPEIRPLMLMADEDGNIFEHPELLMVCRQGGSFSLPRPDELVPLPAESEMFLLPGRKAVGLNPENGELVSLEETAVAAFVSPAHTLSGSAAYVSAPDAPTLPLFAYGAVGFANGRFYVCARRVDQDNRQVFCDIPPAVIRREARNLLKRYPRNRLMQHLMEKCALTYACPAARNLALGRYEAPLPVSRVCNARCIGCISAQDPDSPIQTTPQCRLTFTPAPEEIAEVMLQHGRREKRTPVYSFGQGCEGEPLTEAETIIKAISLFREEESRLGLTPGTVNLNTNASRPEVMEKLAAAGLSSMRVSLNSLRPEVYDRYYRPCGYSFEQVLESIAIAKANGIFVSLNLLYFPGISDCELEVDALIENISRFKIDFIQLRNLNIDPEMYLNLLEGIDFGPNMGLNNFRKRVRRDCPWVRFGYFNPYLGPDGVPVSASLTST